VFKGSLELVKRENVSGWMWCEIATLRGRNVLAFVNGHCIGSGTVGGFRPDLYEAGMGDGECGFSFPITLPGGTHTSEIYVRMENSDFSLFQKSSDPTMSAPSAHLRQRNASIEWMLRRGWLSQDEASFVDAMDEVGAAVVALTAGTSGKSLRGWAADRLGLLLQKEVAVKQTRLSCADMDEVLSAQRTGVVCLRPQGTYRRKVLEGSHLAPQGGGEHLAVIYRTEPHQALFIDRMCASESVRFDITPRRVYRDRILGRPLQVPRINTSPAKLPGTA